MQQHTCEALMTGLEKRHYLRWYEEIDVLPRFGRQHEWKHGWKS